MVETDITNTARNERIQPYRFLWLWEIFVFLEIDDYDWQTGGLGLSGEEPSIEFECHFRNNFNFLKISMKRINEIIIITLNNR